MFQSPVYQAVNLIYDNSSSGLSATDVQAAIDELSANTPAAETLATTLVAGNTSGGTDLIMSTGDKIYTNTISETTAGAGITLVDQIIVANQSDAIKSGNYAIQMKSGVTGTGSQVAITGTWNPAYKGSLISLSNGNLTTTHPASPATWNSVRGTASASSGIVYFQATFDNGRRSEEHTSELQSH